jgi:hypothetical protein
VKNSAPVMIEEFTNVFKVMNPELLLCRMEPSVTLELELTITKGRGYQPADDGAPKMLVSVLFRLMPFIRPSKTCLTKWKTPVLVNVPTTKN